ncbi:MAG: aspartate--tRNA ligase [Patescibacteria group bacterium]
MKRTHIAKLGNEVGNEVRIDGWVSIRRDHGKLIFMDVRDVSGTAQVVVLPNHKEAHDTAQKIRNEWVVEIKGKVNKRPEKMINKDVINGEIELEAMEITVLNESETPPFDLLTDGKEVNEETRLTYRYLDLRRPRLQKNIIIRGKITQFIREYLSKEEFTEMETPILTKSTPEGARDYVVPSRLEKGKFYALPQSPQQYKQLLMVAGLEKYFQIARCMRDEDTRGDRQPEFTQLDLEMSFVSREDVMHLNESLLIELVEKFFSEKKIQEKPFPIITYKEAMDKYGTDSPDLRKDKNNSNILAFCWIVDFPFFSAVGGPASSGKPAWTFTHNPFSAPKPEHLEWLMAEKNIPEILTSQYDIALNGLEIGGGSVRNHQAKALSKVFEIIGYKKEEIENNFGHMLKALSHGAPPHGGIAWGLDRLFSILLDEPNIREVIAFPKTGEGKDLMMNAPSEISKEQLKELGLKL